MEGKLPTALEGQWDCLLKEGQELTFTKGQVLFYEGHEPYGVFVLESGKVRFTKGETSCKEEHFCFTSQGRIIGFHHLLSKTPFCCSCLAETDCEMVFISKTLLLPFLKPNGDPGRG